MDITLQDIIQLQQEAGQAENDQRLRAITAERQVRELQAQLTATIAMLKTNTPPKDTPTP